MKLMGIDYGRRRLGVAVGGDNDAPIRGLPTIDRKKTPGFVTALLAVIEREKPSRLVLGLPLDFNDAETVMSREIRAFAGKLEERTGLPVSFIDESLTSLDAQVLLRYRKKKERRDKGSVDRLAACLILDQYIRESGCT
jgi:putative holliday junction resolvase